MSAQVQVLINEDLKLDAEVGHGTIRLGKTTYPVQVISSHEDAFLIRSGDRNYRVLVESRDESAKEVRLRVNGVPFEIKLQDSYDLLLHQLGMDKISGSRGGNLNAPMPGLVLKVLVKAGDSFDKGDPLLILEAMKMENVLKATEGGVVREVKVSSGHKVEKNQVLLVLE